MKGRKIKAGYLREDSGEYGGSGVQTDRNFSPFTVCSCAAAVAAGMLAAAGIVPSVLSAGAVSEFYAGLGLCGMPVSVFGLWLGIRGKYDREEKRQTAGLTGCVANAVLFIMLAAVYGAGLFW